MKNFIIAKAIFIIIAGLVGSYFIIKSNIGIDSEKPKNEKFSDNSANLIGENPIQWLKNSLQKNKTENFENEIKNFGQIVENKSGIWNSECYFCHKITISKLSF